MKVRHKRLTDGSLWQWDVLSEAGEYYIAKRADIPTLVALPKADYEPIPDDVVWEDVTAQIELDEADNGFIGGQWVLGTPSGYHFVKEQLWRRSCNPFTGSEKGHDPEPVWAFRVKRKVRG